MPYQDYPEPEMYASQPEIPIYTNYRGKKRGKIIKEMALQTTDDGFEQ